MVTSTRYSTYRHDKLARLIGVCVDSTSRVAEVLLHESERKFHALFNGTLHFIGLLIKEGIMLEVKQRELNFSRLQLQDVVGRSYLEIWWTLIVSQQYLQYLVSSTAAIIYTYKSSGYFLSAFLGENFVAITGYRQILEYPSFWTSHLHLVLESFDRASNVGHILGTGLRITIVKKCVDIYYSKIFVTSTLGFGTKITVIKESNIN